MFTRDHRMQTTAATSLCLAVITMLALLIPVEPASAQTEWNNLYSVTHPSPRRGHKMVYDSVRKKIILFGGMDAGNNFYGETWEWDVNTRVWTQRFPATSPKARAYFAMAFDSTRGVVVLQGGRQDWDGDDGDFSPSTWEWDGNNWNYRHAPGPGMRERHEMVYDSQRREMVLFGGTKGSSIYAYDDTWVWNGVGWTQVFPATVPDGRCSYAMAFDSGRSRVVMQGGMDKWDDGYWDYDETWEWNGNNWSLVSMGGPARRSEHSLVYDSARGVVVCFGGTRIWGIDAHQIYTYKETWEWNGSSWSKINIVGDVPCKRYAFGMTYDSHNELVVLWDGRLDGIDNHGIWLYGPQAAYELGLMLVKTRPNVARIGKKLRLIARVKNYGAASSPTTTVNFYLSADQVLELEDLLLGSAALPSLSGERSRKVSVRKLIPETVAPAKYYVIAEVVSSDSNTGNDTMASMKRRFITTILTVLEVR